MANQRRAARQGAWGGAKAANSGARSKRCRLSQAQRPGNTGSDGEALAALGAAGIEDRPTAAGAHAFAEAVRALALHDGGLIGTFGGHVGSPILHANPQRGAKCASGSWASEKPAIRRDNGGSRQTESRIQGCLRPKKATRRGNPATPGHATGEAARKPAKAFTYYLYLR